MRELHTPLLTGDHSAFPSGVPHRAAQELGRRDGRSGGGRDRVPRLEQSRPVDRRLRHPPRRQLAERVPPDRNAGDHRSYGEEICICSTLVQLF